MPIKAPLPSIHSKWASECPARNPTLKIPYDTILLDFRQPVNLLHVKTYLDKQDSIIQNHLSRCDKLHKKQKITSIKICMHTPFSLLSAIKVMYNIQLLLPTQKHGYSLRSPDTPKYQVTFVVIMNPILLQGLVNLLHMHLH